MTAPAAIPVATPTCVIRRCPQTGRLLVGWHWSEDWRRNAQMLADWRRTMVQGRRACWRREQGYWSVRASERARLEAWLDAWGFDVREEV